MRTADPPFSAPILAALEKIGRSKIFHRWGQPLGVAIDASDLSIGVVTGEGATFDDAARAAIKKYIAGINLAATRLDERAAGYSEQARIERARAKTIEALANPPPAPPEPEDPHG